MGHTLELSDSLTISVICETELGDHFLLDLEDEISINIDSFVRGSNNIRLSFEEEVNLEVILDSAYFIRRAADTAFIRTNYP